MIKNRTRLGQHHAPHPSWRREWPPGSVILGRTSTGKYIWLPPEMRKMGVQIVGLPNQGKSKLMESMARQDILALCGMRRAVIFLDPHGSSFQALLNWAVTHGIHRIVPIHVLDLGDPHAVFRLNPLKRRAGVDPAVPAAAVTNAIIRSKDGQDPSATPQLREALKIAFATCAEFGLPLVAAGDLLEIDDSTGLRLRAAIHSKNPLIRAFWRAVDLHKPREREALTGSARRRLNEFLLPQRIREIFSEPEHVLDWRRIMDEGEIVLVNLAYDAGRVSEDEATTVGTLMLSDIFLASRGRPADSIRAFVYVDESHRYATEDAARLFTEARKFNCHPILAHQIFEQLDQAGSFIKGSIMSARNKIFFGGLPPEEAELAARFAFRGQLDLQKPKHRYDKPVVVDHIPEWLRSESDSYGTARATGTNWSESEGVAESRSQTASWSTTISDSDTASQTTTRSRSASRSSSETDQWSHTDTESTGGSASDTRSAARARSTGITQDFPGWYSRSYRLNWPQAGATIADSDTDTTGRATTTGRSSARSTADSAGGARATSRATTHGIAEASGTAHSHGIARTEGLAITKGITHSTSLTQGGSITDTISETRSAGRGQSWRPVLKVLPTQAYTLAELIDTAAAAIAALGQGEAVVKIGRRPATKIRTLRIAEGWAWPEVIERAKARLSIGRPYLIGSAQLTIGQLRPSARIVALPVAPAAPVRGADEIAEPMPEPTAPRAPPLKDEGWS